MQQPGALGGLWKQTMAKALLKPVVCFFFFSVLDLTAENNPPRPGREKDLGRRTLRACLAGASAPTRPDVAQPANGLGGLWKQTWAYYC